jgi:hypothetical protein
VVVQVDYQVQVHQVVQAEVVDILHLILEVQALAVKVMLVVQVEQLQAQQQTQVEAVVALVVLVVMAHHQVVVQAEQVVQELHLLSQELQ